MDQEQSMVLLDFTVGLESWLYTLDSILMIQMEVMILQELLGDCLGGSGNLSPCVCVWLVSHLLNDLKNTDAFWGTNLLPMQKL